MIERGIINRDGIGTECKPVWFSQFRNGWENEGWFVGSCYNKKFLKLHTIEENILDEIVLNYIEAKNANICNNDVNKIVKFSIKLNKGKKSPLLALCVADAYLDDSDKFKNIDKWNREKIFDFIIDREKDRIRNRCPSSIVYEGIIEIQMLACITGGLELSNMKIRNQIEQVLRLLHYKKYNDYMQDILDGVVKLENVYKGKLSSIEPDLIGEYFTLSMLESYCQSGIDIYEMFNFLKEKFSTDVIRFLERFDHDFYIYARNLPRYNEVRKLIGERVSQFVMRDENGEEKVYDVLFTFDSEEDVSYIVYTDNSKDENGNTEVYASIWDKNNSDKMELKGIESEKVWETIETILDSLQQGLREGKTLEEIVEKLES